MQQVATSERFLTVEQRIEQFRSVLSAGKGTCSTKHALLAAVASEQNIPVALTLGIYEMHRTDFSVYA